MGQWDEIYDKPHIHTLDDLHILEVADYYRVPPSWVRSNMSAHEIAQVREFWSIQNERDKERFDLD